MGKKWLFAEAFGVVVKEKGMLYIMKMSKHNFSWSRLMHHPDFAGDKSFKKKLRKIGQN